MNDDYLQCEQLKEFLKNHPTDEILSVVADKMFTQAESLRQAGYPIAAEELERMAYIVGDLHVPGVPTTRKKEIKS